MENNEVKITEHRYKQLLESARRERIMMEILMKESIVKHLNKDPDLLEVADSAVFMLEKVWRVPFQILLSKTQINAYDSAHELVIIHADIEPDFSIIRNI